MKNNESFRQFNDSMEKEIKRERSQVKKVTNHYNKERHVDLKHLNRENVPYLLSYGAF
jgi:hypothetical protein